ncbi:MAG TPA: transketolase C-terminal domain-containing protein, partial [Ktedonobacterales bacterium]
GVAMDEELRILPVGKAEVLTPEADIARSDVAILGYGHMVALVSQAAKELLDEDGIRAVAVNARWAKPLDEDLIVRLAQATGHLITIEDGVAAGGFGSAVLELLNARGLLGEVKLEIIGLPDKFIEHGAVSILRELYQLTPGHIKQVARDMLGVSPAATEAPQATPAPTTKARER